MPPPDAFIARLLHALAAGQYQPAVRVAVGFVGTAPPFEYLQEAARTPAVRAAGGEAC